MGYLYLFLHYMETTQLCMFNDACSICTFKNSVATGTVKIHFVTTKNYHKCHYLHAHLLLAQIRREKLYNKVQTSNVDKQERNIIQLPNLLEHDRTLRIVGTVNRLVITLCLVGTEVNTNTHMHTTV